MVNNRQQNNQSPVQLESQAYSNTGAGSDRNGGSGTPSGGGTPGGNSATGRTIVSYNYTQKDNSYHYKIPVYSDGTTGTRTTERHIYPGGVIANGSKCAKCGFILSSYTPPSNSHGYTFYFNGTKYTNGGYSSKTEALSAANARLNSLKQDLINSGRGMDYVNALASQALSRMEAYETGGLNTYTGLAMLHGTKTKPEAVLNADQTKALREEILGNGRNSLLTSLTTFAHIMKDTMDASNYNNMSNEPMSYSGVTIEHATVNLNANIASDYDARRAGALVMDEMVKIGRKNGFQNNIRR